MSAHANNDLSTGNRKTLGKVDFEYVPGDFTPFEQQHESRYDLLKQKYERDNNIEPVLPLDKLYLGHHNEDCRDIKLDCVKETYRPPLNTIDPQTTTYGKTSLQPYDCDLHTDLESSFARPSDIGGKTINNAAYSQFPMPLRSITVKPNERCPSPVVPAFANFDLARRMHADNLDHQPLPDCVADAAYRRLQFDSNSGGDGGLALDISPIATGVGIRTYNAGPTHCTKMKVYRPKTCGVVPKVYNTSLTSDNDHSFYLNGNSAQNTKKIGAMDLAIGWDFRPNDGSGEPLRPAHIDGSDDVAGAAVFNYVKSPREEEGKALTSAGRSAGVFNSTLGEANFFDKDIIQRKTDITGRHIQTSLDDCIGCVENGSTRKDSLSLPRARSVSRDQMTDCHFPSARLHQQLNEYNSTPNVMSSQEFKTMREKYMGNVSNDKCGRIAVTGAPACRRGFLQRARPCHKVAPVSCCMYKCQDNMPLSHCNPAAFRAGLPKYDATGIFAGIRNGGCGVMTPTTHRVLVVPRPKIPYSKKNYNIDTLVPPFRSSAGGAAEGGYPEHWRLASVYQHAYKPPDLRRRPLLQTVYK